MDNTNTISESSARINKDINLEKLFLSPMVIVKYIYELSN